MDDGEIYIPEMANWTLVDHQLCRLVDQLRARGSHRTLEVDCGLRRSESSL